MEIKIQDLGNELLSNAEISEIKDCIRDLNEAELDIAGGGYYGGGYYGDDDDGYGKKRRPKSRPPKSRPPKGRPPKGRGDDDGYGYGYGDDYGD